MIYSQDLQQELWRCGFAAGGAAAVETLRWFRATDLQIDNKLDGAFDPVTQGDRAAELAMRGVIERLRPDDGILGEEHGAKPSQSGLTWVLDPIDGTRGFMSGTPTWGTLIALCDNDGPVLGVVDQPYIGERFYGGFGAAHLIYRDAPPRPIHTRATKTLSDAILFTTFPEVGTNHDRAGFQAVAGQVKQVRYGMDCYAYALLAAGQIDLVIEAGLQSYDIAAPAALVQAAGGIATNWAGGPCHHGGQVICAANADIHAQALNLLGEFADD